MATTPALQAGILWALLVALLWGISPIIHKHVMTRLDPVVVMVIAASFSTVFMIGFLLVNYGRVTSGWHAVRTSDVAWIGLATLFCSFVANIIYFFVLKEHKSHVVSALIYASPAASLVLAYAVLKEDVTWTGATGVLLVVAGCLCVAFGGGK